MGYRADRLGQELKEQISLILSRELRDPRVGLATVTDVRVSPDLRYARVYASVLGPHDEQAKAVAALNQAAGFIRRQLGARLRLRHTPELTFCFDESIERGARMEELLQEVKKEIPDLSPVETGDSGAEKAPENSSQPTNNAEPSN